MPAAYAVSRVASALSTANDTLTIVAAAGKPLRVLYGDVKGRGAGVNTGTVLLMRSSGGTTPGGAITPSEIDPDGPAASFAVYTTWGAQPSAGEILHRFVVYEKGGQDKYQPAAGDEIYVPAGGQISLRSESGTFDAVPNLKILEG